MTATPGADAGSRVPWAMGPRHEPARLRCQRSALLWIRSSGNARGTSTGSHLICRDGWPRRHSPKCVQTSPCSCRCVCIRISGGGGGGHFCRITRSWLPLYTPAFPCRRVRWASKIGEGISQMAKLPAAKPRGKACKECVVSRLAEPSPQRLGVSSCVLTHTSVPFSATGTHARRHNRPGAVDAFRPASCEDPLRPVLELLGDLDGFLYRVRDPLSNPIVAIPVHLSPPPYKPS
ncbi:hypothetical protein LY76DRAFT_250738 [Colletotrichum caudatum]|nr:hypothetical protein LY76DRAFT_250738 [Colletotrichum caudatum]